MPGWHSGSHSRTPNSSLVPLGRWVQLPNAGWVGLLSYGCSTGQVASLTALMNSPDPGPVAGPAQGRAAAFPTYFPSGFTRRGGWVSWGRPHVSWPSKALPGRAPGPHHTGTSPSAPAWPGSRNRWVWCDGKGGWLGRQPKRGSGQKVLGSRIFTANEGPGPAFLVWVLQPRAMRGV